MTLSEFFIEDEPSDTLLTEENRRLVTYYHALSEAQQKHILELMEEMRQEQPPADQDETKKEI
jgi:hypothetical protein